MSNISGCVSLRKLGPESEAGGKSGRDQQEKGHEYIFQGAARQPVRDPDAERRGQHADRSDDDKPKKAHIAQ